MVLLVLDRARAGGRSSPKHRGYVIIGIFVLAAFLTPPDMISQIIMAVPMYLLYEGGVLLARVLVRAKAPDAEHDPA